jgi:MFS family permease
MYASFVVGYSLAGPIVLAFGSNSVYYVTSIAFIIASALCATLPSLRAEKSVKSIAEINREVFSTIRYSLNKIFTNPRLILPIINLTIGQAMLGILAVLAPAIAMILFGQSLASVSTMLILPAALGMLFGAIIVGQLFKNISKTKVIDGGILLASAMLILLSTIPVFHKLNFFGLIVTVVAFILGFANGLVGVSAQTLLQLNSTDEARGKIFGTLNMAMNIAAIFPVLLAGIAADLINPLYALSGAGVLIAIYGIFQHKAFSRLHLKST